MSIPARPLSALHEGPAGSCVIGGTALGWTNCTPASVAMGISKALMHRQNPTACDVRRLTGDRVGGTTLPQCAHVAVVDYGVAVEVRVGSNVSSVAYAAGQLRAGRGFALQGNAGALIGTPQRSTGGKVNHCVYVNEGRGWTQVAGFWVPSEARVYDPAADGRKAGWGTAATSPQWWPWSLVKRFAAALQPWGDNDPRTLGSGKFYAAFFPDTEPHVHLRFTGSVRTSPFPKPMTIHSPVKGQRVNVRSGPSRSYPVQQRLSSATAFTAYQQNPKGQLLAGSRLWYGDHNGKLWVHSSGVR